MVRLARLTFCSILIVTAGIGYTRVILENTGIVLVTIAILLLPLGCPILQTMTRITNPFQSQE